MSEQEFTVRIPQRNDQKKYYVMKFNSSLGVDVTKWNQVRMVRENNKRERAPGEEMPKFGAGSEFGREQKEEARRKKFGMISKKYDPDAQPWLMRIGSKKEGKHYKGIREGGVSNNTTYYVFTHAQDGSFEVHPVKEWYNFTPRVNYKTLNAEEAEEKFAERSKILNHWAVMVNKKLRPDAEDAEDHDEEGKGSRKGKAGKSFKLSDMDDWVDEDDGLDSSDEGSDDEGSSKKKKKKDEDKGKGNKDSKKKKKKSKEDVDNEAFEDSDDGDDEGREVDYITDESSEGEDEIAEAVAMKGVDQDEGLAKLLDSDSSSDEDEEKKEDKEGNEEEGEDGKGKKGKKKSKEDKKSADGKDEEKGKKSAAGSRTASPTPADDGKASRAEKRKAMVDNLLDPNAPETKKSRMDPFTPASASSSAPATSSTEAMFEEDVRRYLARKPMTTTEILKKIKSRKTGIPKEELMPLLVSALKRINPHKQKVKGIMYLSLKTK